MNWVVLWCFVLYSFCPLTILFSTRYPAPIFKRNTLPEYVVDRSFYRVICFFLTFVVIFQVNGTIYGDNGFIIFDFLLFFVVTRLETIVKTFKFHRVWILIISKRVQIFKKKNSRSFLVSIWLHADKSSVCPTGNFTNEYIHSVCSINIRL